MDVEQKAKKITISSPVAAFDRQLLVHPRQTITQVIKKAQNKLQIKQEIIHVATVQGTLVQSVSDIKEGDVLIFSTTMTSVRANPELDETGAKSITFVEAGAGRFALRGKPSRSLIKELAKVSTCTHIVTLQAEREGARELGKSVQEVGLQWIWFPLNNARPPPYSQVMTLLDKVLEICAVLQSGGHVVFHCAAGLHRTGMIANTVLRYLGYSEADALQKIRQAREETANQCGAQRLRVAEVFIELCGTLENPIPYEKVLEESTKLGNKPLVEKRQRNS